MIAGKDKSSTNRVQTWLYKYEAGSNSCTDLTKHSVISSEVSLEDVSDVFVAYSPKDTPDDLQLIMVFESGTAYSVEITNGKTV